MRASAPAQNIFLTSPIIAALSSGGWKAAIFLYQNVSMAAMFFRPFVGLRATDRQKAIPFIIAGNLKAVVWSRRRQAAGPGGGGEKGHIMFQMTEQRFIYPLAFLHGEEK